MFLCKPGNYQVLGIICVLVFIDQDIAEHLLVFFQDIGEIPEKDIGIKEKVVEIHGISGMTAFLVYPEYFGDHRFAVPAVFCRQC